jgi:hypothetical protein
MSRDVLDHQDHQDHEGDLGDLSDPRSMKALYNTGTSATRKELRAQLIIAIVSYLLSYFCL